MADKLDIGHFQGLLEAMLESSQQLQKQVEDSAQTVELDQNRVGRLSRMDAMQGQALAKASAHRQHAQHSEIVKALARITDGSYGRCLECDELIAPARLEINPTVQFCIGCATELERN
ncbi:MAG: TraR/DksA C4-type zinc finger protein [Pseudomonadota bacterium]